MSSFTRSTASNLGTGATFETKVSLYDRVFGGLLALIVLSLFLFTVLSSIWWFQTPLTGAPGDLDTGQFVSKPDKEEKEEPNVVEYDGSESQAFTESIELTGISIAEVFAKNASDSQGTGIGIAGDKDGPGIGIGRTPGPAQAGAPPNWSVTQESPNLAGYQSKLDFFAIEIGAVHKTNDKIWRIAKLSTEKVVTESSRSAESETRYFVNKRQRLLQWDRQTIAQAGVDPQDVIAVHFYPKQLILKMQQLIDSRYKDRAKDLASVAFRIVGTAGDFRFEIEDAQFEN